MIFTMRSKLLLFVFVSTQLFAQVEKDFLSYLSLNKLEAEQLTYLNAQDTSLNFDTLHFYKAQHYLQYFNDSLFRYHLSFSTALFFADSSLVNSANCRFLKENNARRASWYQLANKQSRSNVLQNAALYYDAGVYPKKYVVDQFSSELKTSFALYKKIEQRNPFAAMALSAVVPGLGKYYGGRKRSFVNTLLLHSIYGFQTYESIAKLGVYHPYSIFSMGLFSLFYVANVYTSYSDLKECKTMLRNQYYEDVSDYFNPTVHPFFR